MSVNDQPKTESNQNTVTLHGRTHTDMDNANSSETRARVTTIIKAPMIRYCKIQSHQNVIGCKMQHVTMTRGPKT